MSYLTHLQCAACGGIFPADRLWNVCPECGKPLLARYDLTAARARLDRGHVAGRRFKLWRYRELLPVQDVANILNLGEGGTPLIPARRLGEQIGHEQLFVKDESGNPTASFKARGLSVAVSRAGELGVKALSIPSAGNAAGAMSAYAAAAGMAAHVYMPKDVPETFRVECRAYGADVTLVDGLITDCAAQAVRDGQGSERFDISTLREPYRIEGKKTMGFEIAEQMGWSLPDVIIYPTGGGTGLIGMWKAFQELEALGWIGPKRPRMVAVQADGCAPIVRAFHQGASEAEPWVNAHTLAAGLRVPAAIGDFLMLECLRDSHGTAVGVSDAALLDGADQLAKLEGVFACPEGGATVAALHRLTKSGWIGADETVVLLNTGSGLKYTHIWNSSA
jgi:threonine synthase